MFPGSQIGNLYNNKFIKQHFLTQKYIVKKIKILANNNIIIPILAICHGYENMILIEKNYNLTNKNIKNTFINVYSYSDYKTIPKFKNSKLGKLFKKNFNKTKKLIHNNSLALALNKKNRIKNYEIIATSLDKNNKEFIDIVKHKKYPFFGYQGHPELNNPKLFAPFIRYVNESFNKKKINNNINTNSLNLIKLKSRKVSCNKVKLAKTIKHGKCIFYKI